MGQDKKRLNQLLAFVKELYDDPDNREFAAGIQSIVGSGAVSNSMDSERMDEIYELCLEKNARDQAMGLYEEFPFKSIKESLIEDYVIMERFRRKGDFLNFSAHLFLQIESICNAVCADERYQKIYSTLVNANVPAFIDYKGGIRDRREGSSMTISKLIFGNYEVTDRGDKKNTSLLDLWMVERVKCTLYFAAFGTCMSPSDLGEWKYNTNLLNDIYSVRCQADHRGGNMSEYKESRLREILPHKNRYYSVFFSELTYFVNKIIEGAQFTESLLEYAKSLSDDVEPESPPDVVEEESLPVIVEEEYTVSSALPGALFIKSERGSTEQVPANAYDRRLPFANGMPVIVTKTDGVITRVIPKE